MTDKMFNREEYPLDILGAFGLTENMIYDLPGYIHENIEAGGLSPLLPITVEQPFGYSHCYAKFCLVKLEDGIGVMFSPKLKTADLSYITEAERELLSEGKAIVADVEENVMTGPGQEKKEKIKAFVQLDQDTNNVVYVPSQIIGRNIRTISEEFNLPEEALQGFWEGKLVTLNLSDGDNPVMNLTIGINLFTAKGIAMVPGDAERWNIIEHRAMPEYSFGNDGCWVNRHGVLSYVPEEKFTQDILDALDKQARQAGMQSDYDNARDISREHRYDEDTEQARQMTRQTGKTI